MLVLEDDLLLHPLITTRPPVSRKTIVRARIALRLRTGKTSSSNPASIIPTGPLEGREAVEQLPAVEAATVAIVAVTVLVPLAVSDTLAADRLQVGGSETVAVPVKVIAQTRPTEPTKPFVEVSVIVSVLPVVAPGASVRVAGEGVRVNEAEPEVEIGDPDATARKLATLSEPRPVASSYPVPTSKPAKPPVNVVGPGVLLLHIDGVAVVQFVTPEVATVTSLKALGVEVAIE